MEILQHILVYLTVAISLGYLVFKFLLPKTLFSSGKDNSKACGQDDCGCH
ncbi:hypothetical protein PP182_03570 [Maribacter sp. PR1]|uniref:FeoB-associated Cys-rich membrane protein n=1 Tax=Maribacter cobaltidurans TaxID=1178778 RepID=A0ABU7IQH8_9FLAO|nr:MULTISPECIES: hypothetical protein [Maribacter]MDC6387744.1 hypothetical protein [Maribacter sp. PR1]MEE1975133.1 hypothetical protein [Maribacter cobaltidurans]